MFARLRFGHGLPLALAGLATAFPAIAAALPAFPGAEGFAAEITGGRGGQVLRVTSLAESGPGSLREALETPGPRIIVFEVSGVIDLGEPNTDDIFDESDGNNVLTIPEGDVTIAGQTAPGAGITIRGRLYAAYDEGVGNIIVRHLRIRPPAWPGGGDGGEQYDALRFSVNAEVLVDHVTVSGGVDECVDLYEGRDITFQWSTVEEAADEGHPEGAHNYGLLNYGGRTSVHHSLFAHNRNRNPALATGPSESINNTAYNVRHGFVNHNDASGEITVVGNTFIQGPNDSLIPLFFDGGEGVQYWLADNAVDDPGEFSGVIDDPWTEAYFDNIGASDAVRAGGPFTFDGGFYLPVGVQPAAEAHADVLACAGAFPRDAGTLRVLQELADRGGDWGAKYPADLLAGLSPGTAPADGDHDGMPDAWESDHGLDPADGDDHATVMPSGYTAIEEYINERADMIACGAPDPGDTTGDDTTGTTGSDPTGSDPTGSDPTGGPTSGDAPTTGGSAGDTSGQVEETMSPGTSDGPGPGGASDTTGAGQTDAGGCACRSGGPGPADAWWAALLLPLLRRRRR
ncbi:pectate lyase family protein [Nannocystis pusilla]|uniref:Pectate lyase n=1 Tax=Nannocystis pusilla TaxID=889268 RepID=A0ABS7U677_9BACT|nr:pectate lyase precursor [Nannocystis pusilla]MBZ5715810.1 pectate lyase precursor [Nannocystis pusilla]